jgi:hypothetical protein
MKVACWEQLGQLSSAAPSASRAPPRKRGCVTSVTRRRRPAKPLDSSAHSGPLHQSAAAYVTATGPWRCKAVALWPFHARRPLATHQLHQYHGPIADDAISCNLLAPTRCGPLAHFSPSPWPSPFPRGAAVAQGGHVCQVSSHRLNIATFFFYTRRTTVSRACSIGSVDNKALHVPVTSGGIGRLHLLPIAYCLPIAHLLP